MEVPSTEWLTPRETAELWSEIAGLPRSTQTVRRMAADGRLEALGVKTIHAGSRVLVERDSLLLAMIELHTRAGEALQYCAAVVGLDISQVCRAACSRLEDAGKRGVAERAQQKT